jgi:UDP-N-acetylglucosamine acyltransferase
MSHIHPTAIIAASAEIGEGARIGPYCVIGDNVKLGKDSVLHSHVVLAGYTHIGERAEIFQFASIGDRPGDLKYHGEPSTLEIGDDIVIREYVTMNPGTEGGGMVTKIGNNCVFLPSAHVGHDATVGNNVIFSNAAMIAGHSHVDDYAILGAGAGLHQFCRIGKHAIVGGMSAVDADVIPFGAVVGNRANLAGLNIVGLKRRGFTREQIHELREAYREIFSSEATLRERVEKVAERYRDTAEVMEIVNFIQAQSDRALCLPRND